jgi:hypothetical protein
MSRLGASDKPIRSAQTERLDRIVQSEPRLILQQSASYPAADCIPLGIRVDGKTNGMALEISDLPSGAIISSGRPLGTGVWRIRASDVGNAVIHLPPGFSGTIDLAVELRRSDDTVVDRGSVHREWLDRPPVAATMIEPVRGMTVSDTTASKVTATSTSTDETAQKRMTPHRVGGGASIETGGAKIVLKVEPQADKGNSVTATAFAKRKMGAVRPRNHTQAAHDDRYQVYSAGSRAGADPDLDIRMTLARQYGWM